MASLEVTVINNQQDLVIHEEDVEITVMETVANEGADYDEVGVFFVSTKEITRLHTNFFSDPTPTDCISFPMDQPDAEGFKSLGEVFVCPATAIAYVKENGGNVWEETLLYVVHGILHLLGYDDTTDAERRKMREAEARNMENVRRRLRLFGYG